MNQQPYTGGEGTDMHFRRLPPDTAAELSALAERLATLSLHGRIDCSDSWTDEDLQVFRASSLKRLEDEELEEPG